MNSEKAALYEKYRLPYPKEMVDDLLSHTGHAELIADIGAGTGQLARLFAPQCSKVYAVEPDNAMRTVASDVLKGYPNIHIVNASAELTTLPDGSIDLIVIGNAFHRFKEEAIEELRRILKPSGWVALISYTFTDAAFSNLLFSKLSELKNLTARQTKTMHHLSPDRLFGVHPVQTLSYPRSVNEDWEVFWGSARSGIEAPEPHDDDFEPFKAVNQEIFDSLSVDGHIRIEYETRVVFGQPKL